MNPKVKPAPLYAKRKRRKDRRLIDRLRALAGLKLANLFDEQPPSHLGLAS